MSEEQGQHQESEFDQAFSEAAQHEAAPEPADTNPDESGETGEQGDDKEPGSDTAGEEDWRAKFEEERRLREEAEQRMRSWDGRLRKSNEELERERKARQEIERRLVALEERNNSSNREKLQEFLDEWGEDEEMAPIAEAVRAQLKAAEARADTDADTSAGEGETQTDDDAQAEEEARKSHFDAIEQEHGDWQQIVASGELNGWIKSLNGEEALKYSQVAEKGTATEVIDMLSAFKAAKRGGGKQTDTTDDAEAMAAVRHRSGGVRPKTRAGKDDFDAAWDEAVGQDK